MLAAAAAACLTVTLAAAQPAVQPRPALVAQPALVAPPALVARPARVAQPALIAYPGPAAAPLPVVQPANGCWTDEYHGSFTGSTTTTGGGAHPIVTEMIGTRDGDRVVQTQLGDTRVCMVAEGAVGLEDARPSQWSAPRVLMESRRGSATAQMEIRGTQITWRVNGAERPVDQRAEAWRRAMLAALDQVWDISTLRGQVSTLRGQISTIRGEESSLRGQISSLRGEVSSMRGEQSTVRGQESSLRGEISSIEGQLSSLRGQISSEEGAISSLNADRYGSSAADRDRLAAQIKSHEDDIARLERQIRDYDAASKVAAVEKQIQALDAEGKTAAIEDRIRTFDEAGKVAAIEKQIQALDVDGKTAEIERRITSLDADRRTRQMQDALDDAIRQLDKAIAAIR